MNRTIYRIISLALFLSFIVAGVLSCAPAPKKLDTSNLVWPPPPSPTRIKFLEILKDNRDIEEADFATKLLGDEGARSSLVFPRAVAVDNQGRIYVSHALGILVFDKENKKTYRFGKGIGTENVVNPRGLATTRDGNIYISDTRQRKVLVYSTDDEFLFSIGQKGQFIDPQSVAIDHNKSRLIVGDARAQKVFAFDLNGNFLFECQNPSMEKVMQKEGAILGTVGQVAVDSNSNIYAVDIVSGSIFKFDPEGNYVTHYGFLSDTPGNFVRPKGIAIDSDDNIYVSDSGFNNIQVFNSKFQYLMFFGKGGQAPGNFVTPLYLHFDINDKLYVADRINNRVQIFQYIKGDPYNLNPKAKEILKKTE